MLRKNVAAVVETPAVVDSGQPLVLPVKPDAVDFYLSVRDADLTSPGRHPLLPTAQAEDLRVARSDRWVISRSEVGLQAVPIGDVTDLWKVRLRLFISYVPDGTTPPELQRMECGTLGPVDQPELVNRKAIWRVAESATSTAELVVNQDLRFWSITIEALVRLVFEPFNASFVFDAVFDQFGFSYRGIVGGQPVGHLTFNSVLPTSSDLENINLFSDDAQTSTEEYPIGSIRLYGWAYQLLRADVQRDPPPNDYTPDFNLIEELQ